jgi:hypothetical protein
MYMPINNLHFKLIKYDIFYYLFQNPVFILKELNFNLNNQI